MLTGILGGGPEEFDTGDDIYDAIGHILQEMDTDKTEDDIREICDHMRDVMET